MNIEHELLGIKSLLKRIYSRLNEHEPSNDNHVWINSRDVYKLTGWTSGQLRHRRDTKQVISKAQGKKKTLYRLDTIPKIKGQDTTPTLSN